MSIKYMVGFVVAAALSVLIPIRTEAATRIHYIALKGSTDAILLEDNGHFGLIDSGEDWDYPNSDNLTYPFRTGIVTNQGFEQQVIYYMKSVGVTSSNLDFYIGTHAHSDHIGSADEVIRTFRPGIVYLKKYADSNITSKANRWDNRYVYDTLLKEASAQGVKVVQSLKEGMKVTLGSQTKLYLYNTAVQTRVSDENTNSLVIKMKAYGTTALLTGDMEPATARKLLNKGVIGKTDILKLPHHGYQQNNPDDLLLKFVPRTAIVTGPLSNLSASTTVTLKKLGTDIRSVHTSGAAVVNECSAAGYTTTTKTVKAGWFEWEGNRCRMDKNGRPLTGWNKLSNSWYYFDKTGNVQTGWKNIGGKMYYLLKSDSGNYKKGRMLTGWQSIGGKCFYFEKSTGAMLTGWQTIDGKVFYLKKTGQAGEKGQAMTGWRSYNGRLYYFKKNGGRSVTGRMLTGWQSIGGEMFYFKPTGNVSWSKGQLLTGWQTINGKTYYLKKSGAAGVKGRAATGWQLLDGRSYYFKVAGEKDVKGRMLTGWQSIGGYYYYFSKTGNVGWSKGKLLMGWQTIDGKRYYLSEVDKAGWRGRAALGFTEIDGEVYYFRSDGDRGVAGQLMTGSLIFDDIMYVLEKDGKLADIRMTASGSDGLFYENSSMYLYNAGELVEEPLYDLSFDGGVTCELNRREEEGALISISAVLTDKLSEKYDLYYQVYLKDQGWLGWAAAGETAGVGDDAADLTDSVITAVRLQIRPKGQEAPGDGESPVWVCQTDGEEEPPLDDIVDDAEENERIEDENEGGEDEEESESSSDSGVDPEPFVYTDSSGSSE